MASTRSFLPLAAVMLLALMAQQASAAFPTTQGLRFNGYDMVSDVTGYSNMTQDLCQIKEALQVGDIARAQYIYLNGSNSFSGTSMRKFQSWAIAQSTGEYTWTVLTQNGTDPLWIDRAILEAFNTSNSAAAYNLILVTLQYKYMMHEVDAALRRTTTNLTSPISGAPHNLDEAWAIFAGAHPTICDTLYTTMAQLAEEMGTTYYNYPLTVLAATHQYNEIQAAALMGSVATKMFNDTLQELRVQFATFMAQGVLRNAYEAQLLAECKKDTTASVSVAHVYWATLSPQLAAWGADAGLLGQVDDALIAYVTPTYYSRVWSALARVLGPVDTQAVGTPQFDKINQDPTCKRPSWI